MPDDVEPCLTEEDRHFIVDSDQEENPDPPPNPYLDYDDDYIYPSQKRPGHKPKTSWADRLGWAKPLATESSESLEKEDNMHVSVSDSDLPIFYPGYRDSDVSIPCRLLSQTATMSSDDETDTIAADDILNTSLECSLACRRVSFSDEVSIHKFPKSGMAVQGLVLERVGDRENGTLKNQIIRHQ